MANRPQAAAGDRFQEIGFRAGVWFLFLAFGNAGINVTCVAAK
jgi:hypothetical protein